MDQSKEHKENQPSIICFHEILLVIPVFVELKIKTDTKKQRENGVKLCVKKKTVQVIDHEDGTERGKLPELAKG